MPTLPTPFGLQFRLTGPHVQVDVIVTHMVQLTDLLQKEFQLSLPLASDVAGLLYHHGVLTIVHGAWTAERLGTVYLVLD